MTVAYDYPLLEVFWTMLFLSLWIAWIITVFRVVIDTFRNRELRGIQRATWLLLVVFLPLVGVVGYVVVWGDSMGDRS